VPRYSHRIRCLILCLITATVCSFASRASAESLCDSSFTNCRTALLTLIDNEKIGIDVGF